MRAWLIAVALAVAAAFSPAVAQTLLSASEFRDAAIALIVAEDPAARVEIVDDLAVVVRGSQNPEFRVNFDNAYREYQAAPEALAEILDRWVRFSIGPHEESQLAERVVSVVRHRDMLDGYAEMMVGAERPSPLVWRALAGDLIEIVVFDGAETIQYATEETLAELGLSPEQAWAVAPDNLPERIGSLDVGAVEGADQLAYITGGNGLAPSSLLGMCDGQGGDFSGYLFIVVERNGYIMGDGRDGVAAQQFWALVNDIRLGGGDVFSHTALACRDGRLAAVAETQ